VIVLPTTEKEIGLPCEVVPNQFPWYVAVGVGAEGALSHPMMLATLNKAGPNEYRVIDANTCMIQFLLSTNTRHNVSCHSGVSTSPWERASQLFL
jgi:hypothetical protein